MRRLPTTGSALLIGMAALAGLPLLGGFVGEWLLFRSLIGGADLASASLPDTLPLLCGVLALAGGLALAFCANLFSMGFLGRPRRPAPVTAPTSLSSRSVLPLAAVSLALGVFPWLAFKPIFAVMQDLLPGLVIAPFFGTVEHALPWLGLLLLLLSVAALLYRRGPVRRTATAWACGAPSLTPRMEYTATSLTKPIRSVFHPVYRPDRTVTVTPALPHPEGKYFPSAIRYRSQATVSSERYLFRPAAALVLGWARWFRRLQSGDLQQYLLYLFLTLIGLLLCMRCLG
jgi:hydrogenase-4 component B